MLYEVITYILYQHIGAGMKSYESIPLSLGIFYAAAGRYKDGLLAAINIGDDADTNGAIVGALCGGYSGAGAIDAAWIDKLRETNDIDFKSLAEKLVVVITSYSIHYTKLYDKRSGIQC